MRAVSYRCTPKDHHMSYSFTIRAASKTEAKTKVAGELASVVQRQPEHARDMPEAQATCNAFIDLLADDDVKIVQVSVNGSIGWTGVADAALLQNACVSVSAFLTMRLPADVSP
jgi:hypothetical protein